MSFKAIILLFISCFLSFSLCERLPENLLGGWGEKVCSESTKDYGLVMKNIETYLTDSGYSLDDYEIIPVGFFKQVVNGVNYRLIFFVKKKSSLSPTIFDIRLHKNGNDLKITSANKPGYSSSNTKEQKTLTQIKAAVAKHFLGSEYELTSVDIQYEYHKIEGLNDYAVFDVVANLKTKEESSSRRLIIVYRNDKTYVAETELSASE